jgi:hypothetical protein
MNDCVIAFPKLIRAHLYPGQIARTSKDEREGDAGACHALDDKIVRHDGAVWNQGFFDDAMG